MIIDGSTLDMPDEAANAAHFGYAGSSRGSTAYAQLRCVGIAECGTHTLCFAEPGPYRVGEWALSGAVMDHADASGRAVRSRGKRNSRGVRRKMTAHHLRMRGDPVNQPCEPEPRQVAKYTGWILKGGA